MRAPLIQPINVVDLPSSSTASDGDEAALARWLAIAAHRNPHTFRSYAREANRWRLFLALLHADDPSRPVATLMRDATERDVAMYEAVLLGKAPPTFLDRLVAPSDMLRAFGFSKQPFVQEVDGILQPRPLKRASVALALSILHALYEFWLLPDAQTRVAYVGANPVRRLKRATIRMQRQTKRIFPLAALQAMLMLCRLDLDRAKNTGERLRAIRRRWMLSLLFGLWGRRAEIVALRMNDFKHDGKRWTVRLQRKGGKEQTLPVASWVMDALIEYRQALGLPGLPTVNDDRPALLPLRPHTLKNDKKPLDPGTLYREITALAKRTANVLDTIMPDLNALEREQTVAALRSLSPHWFRHTAASIAIESGAMSLENASRVLGHSSTVVTAAMYYHPEEQKIAEGLQKMGAIFDEEGRSTTESMPQANS